MQPLLKHWLCTYMDQYGPVDDDAARGLAEARHSGIVADLKVEGGGTRSIGAGLEQQRIALSSKLVGDLLVGDSVDPNMPTSQIQAAASRNKSA